MIPGATSATYTPVEGPDADADGKSELDADVVSDVGRYLVAVVSYTDAKQNVDEVPKDMARLVSANLVASGHEETERRCSRTRTTTPRRMHDCSPTMREVAENTKDAVGKAVIAEDPDPNADPLTYALSGADAGLFTVDADDATTGGRG